MQIFADSAVVLISGVYVGLDCIYVDGSPRPW